MVSLYHVNPTTGEPGRCQAHHGKCPFNTDGSGVNHFNTKNEVINASEHIIENQETEDGGGNNKLFHNDSRSKKNQAPKEIPNPGHIYDLLDDRDNYYVKDVSTGKDGVNGIVRLKGRDNLMFKIDSTSGSYKVKSYHNYQGGFYRPRIVNKEFSTAEDAINWCEKSSSMWEERETSFEEEPINKPSANYEDSAKYFRKAVKNNDNSDFLFYASRQSDINNGRISIQGQDGLGFEITPKSDNDYEVVSYHVPSYDKYGKRFNRKRLNDHKETHKKFTSKEDAMRWCNMASQMWYDDTDDFEVDGVETID